MPWPIEYFHYIPAPSSIIDMMPGALKAMTQCASVKPGENVVIACDTNKLRLAEVLAAAAYAVGGKPVIAMFPPTGAHGAQVPKPVVAACAQSDVFFLPTSWSMTHTDARVEAIKNGAKKMIESLVNWVLSFQKRRPSELLRRQVPISPGTLLVVRSSMKQGYFASVASLPLYLIARSTFLQSRAQPREFSWVMSDSWAMVFFEMSRLLFELAKVKLLMWRGVSQPNIFGIRWPRSKIPPHIIWLNLPRGSIPFAVLMPPIWRIWGSLALHIMG